MTESKAASASGVLTLPGVFPVFSGKALLFFVWQRQKIHNAGIIVIRYKKIISIWAVGDEVILTLLRFFCKIRIKV